MAEKVKCDICDRIFKDVEGLTMHNLAKHSEKTSIQKRFPTKKIKNWVMFVIVLGLIVWAAWGLIGQQEKYDVFAQCIAESGAKMYGAYWCSACLQQKSFLGNSDEIPYVECSLPNRGQTEECMNSNIDSYPTWEFADGSRIVGAFDKEFLGEKTDCVFGTRN